MSEPVNFDPYGALVDLAANEGGVSNEPMGGSLFGSSPGSDALQSGGRGVSYYCYRMHVSLFFQLSSVF